MKLTCTPSNPGTFTPSDLLIQSPISTCASPIGTFVKTFDTQHAAIAKGTFTRNLIANTAAKIICNGSTRIIEKNIPIASPEATVSRQGFHKCLSKIGLVSVFHHGLSRILLCLNRR